MVVVFLNRTFAAAAVALVALASGRARAADPPSETSFPAVTGPTGAAPPAAATNATDAPVDPRIGSADASRLRFVSGFGTHAAFGLAPAVAMGVHANAELVSAWASLGLEGRFDLPATGDGVDGRRIRTSVAGASVVPCLRAGRAWACGLVFVGRASSEWPSTATRDAAFLVWGAGARLAFHIGLPSDFALRLTADVLGHPDGYELIADNRTVLKAPAVSGTAGLGLVRLF